MTPSVVLSRPSPCNVPHKGTLQSPGSLRPYWDVILSILREAIVFILGRCGFKYVHHVHRCALVVLA
jgi:hypothetical protein